MSRLRRGGSADRRLRRRIASGRNPAGVDADGADANSARDAPGGDAIRRMIARAFGRTVRAARRACGMTQEGLAVRAQLDRTYPSLLERGLRTPTLTSLFAISHALNVHPSELVADAWHAYRTGCAGAPLPDPAVSPRDPLESVAPTMTPNAPVPKVP